MKTDEHVVGEAIRIEYNENDDRLFIVFEVKDSKYKQDIKKNWHQDIEYRLIGKDLVKNDIK